VGRTLNERVACATDVVALHLALPTVLKQLDRARSLLHIGHGGQNLLECPISGCRFVALVADFVLNTAEYRYSVSLVPLLS
jgi:hypothetical protein